MHTLQTLKHMQCTGLLNQTYSRTMMYLFENFLKKNLSKTTRKKVKDNPYLQC